MQPIKTVREEAEGEFELELVVAAVPDHRACIVAHRRGDRRGPWCAVPAALILLRLITLIAVASRMTELAGGAAIPRACSPPSPGCVETHRFVNAWRKRGSVVLRMPANAVGECLNSTC